MNRTLFTFVLCGLALAAVAQTPSKRLAFESASIKPSNRTGIHFDGSPAFMRTSGTLKGLIRTAYGVEMDRIEGGPKWVDQDTFEIEARAAQAVDAMQLREMLQTLLEERFHLQFHRATRQAPGYALLIAKNGLKITPVVGGDHQSTRGGDGDITATNEPFSDFVIRLSRILGAPVVDETRTPGYFDFKLTWSPESIHPSPSSINVNSPTTAMPDAALFTAIQEQLGLRLESRKVPVELLVVDRAEKPF